MFDGISDANLVFFVGLFGGVLLGLAARLGRFCTLGAIEDLLYAKDDTRMRMWSIAIGVAVTGSFLLIASGNLNVENTLYLGRGFNPVAHIAGGLMFGYGMALAGNCGYGALARLGGGDLRSFVIVLVMGIAALATASGPLALLRTTIFPDDLLALGWPPGIAHSIGHALGVNATVIGIPVGVVIIAIAIRSRSFLGKPSSAIWASVVGLAVVSGWAGTNWISQNGFDATPTVSHTFAAPIGRTILYVLTSSGSSLNFSVGSVLGVLAGAAVGSLIKGNFRWEACDDPRELKRQILGAVLMGIGAVVALGCTIGQGISAFSLLVFSAPITLGAIFLGAAVGLRQLISGFALRA